MNIAQETIRDQKFQELHNEMITQNVTTLARAARESFAPLSIDVTGAKWTYLANPRDEKECISVMFPVVVSDDFFGGMYDRAYTLSQRRGLIGALYSEQVMPVLFDRFPNVNVYLDAFPMPSTHNSHVHTFPDIEHAVVEDIVSVQSLVEKNIITPRGDIYKYCHDYYGLDEVLTDSGHIVSPDPSTVDSFFQLGLSDSSIKSVLEIGAGVSPTAALAQKIGITDYTIVDSSPKVCSYLSHRHPSYRVIKGDALEENVINRVADRRYDVVICGLPYEFDPLFLERFGRTLSKHTRYMIIQSGSPGFYQWEHDLLMGKNETQGWPWWNTHMNVRTHFPYVIEAVCSYQHTIISSREAGIIDAPQFMKRLYSAGFSSHSWIGQIQL